MNIDIISAVPSLLEGWFAHSILERANQKALLNVRIIDLRQYALNKQGKIDDYQYGGGAGMVLMAEPISRAIDDLQRQRSYDEIIYLTPDGQPLVQKTVNRLSLKNNLLLLCGHYKGIDYRIRQHYVTLEISIGDFVVSGGEIPAALLTDAIGRLLPGAINDGTSALFDSFQDGLLAPPVYTRPAVFKGLEVPPILLSGHAAAIDTWRQEQAQLLTQRCRPDLLATDLDL